MTTPVRVDRAQLVRRAMVTLVADRGFHGASMAAVAELAGVATGTAYVHYASKDDLVLHAYREVKAELGQAAAAAATPGVLPAARFRAMWFAIHRHLASDPVRARFLAQVDASPYGSVAHATVLADEENELLAALGDDLIDELVQLPMSVIADLSIGPLVRIVSSDERLTGPELERLADGCWRAITT